LIVSRNWSVPFGALQISLLQAKKVRTKSRRQRRLGRPHPASKRESGNTDRNRCFRPHVVSVRLRPTGEPGWSQYNVEVVPKTPAHNGLVRFRNSLRWCGGSTAGQRWHHIPFIDHVGQIHATSLAKWRCTAPQLFATITSTVFKRLWGQTRYGPIKDRCKSGLLYKVAQVYTITNDDSFFRRSLSMLARQRHTELGKFVYYKIRIWTPITGFCTTKPFMELYGFNPGRTVVLAEYCPTR